MFKNLFKTTSKNTAQKNTSTPFLMTPGPVHVPAEIMESFGAPIIHHRTETFEADLKVVLQKLPLIFKTTQPVFLHTSTGSGAMESAIVNTLSPGDTVLAIECGKFGERWTEISKAYGLNPIVYKVEWGKAFDVAIVKKYLDETPHIRAVLCQGCDTSTGILNPLQELGELVSRHNAITIVDGITSLGATRLQMDAWKLDVVLGGSQKAFMLPTGLSMIAFSEKAWGFMKTSKLPKYYWDIAREKKANEKNQTFFSSPVSLIRALKTSIDIILKVGVDEFVERHEQIAQAFREGGKKLGLEVFAQTPSPTVTAFKLPEGISGEKVQFLMENKFCVTIAGGQDHLKGKIIRIGHMGAIEKEHVALTLEKLSLALTELGHKTTSDEAIQTAYSILKNLKPLPSL